MESWPDSKKDYSHSFQVKKNKEIQTFHVTTFQPIIDAKNYSSYFRLLRVTAWILRFISNCRSQDKKVGEFDTVEIYDARNYWIQVVQKESFPLVYEALSTSKSLPKNSKITKFSPLFENKLLGIGGRLQFSSLSDSLKLPILLDGSHHFTSLLIRQTHVKMHHLGVRIVLSELRSNFWILRGRQAIKQVICKCLPCKMSRVIRRTQIKAPLPADRINPVTPFFTTGIDFAGPVHARTLNPSDTAYIATTRAIHLELVSDLSIDKFLVALQQFVGRRGLPHTIYSDNAATFHSANKELILLRNTLTSTKVQQFYAHNGII
ncbi:uncharacterized protein [Parasteatoda tepidariorum]|uniref:uncharacterized protein n=1 Tax=Parasteatoda tepidariorum TaxID=114398 RepID=UPI0039BC70A0